MRAPSAVARGRVFPGCLTHFTIPTLRAPATARQGQPALAEGATRHKRNAADRLWKVPNERCAEAVTNVPRAVGQPALGREGMILPYTPAANWLGFVPPPATFFAFLAVVVVTYLILVEGIKRWFYRRYDR
jgi:hypothetical protein